MTLRFWVCFFTTIFLLFVNACTKNRDEDVIRSALDEMTQAIEKKEAKSLLSHLAENFQGPEGLDRNGVHGLLAYQFVRNQNIKVFIAGLHVTVTGQRAITRFKATLTGAEGLLPERLDYYDVELEWWKDKKQWSVTKASWQPFFGGEK